MKPWLNTLERNTSLSRAQITAGRPGEEWRHVWMHLFYLLNQVDKYEELQGYQWDRDRLTIDQWDALPGDFVRWRISLPLFFGPLREDGTR